jgi:RND superfamily putative drug exporter
MEVVLLVGLAVGVDYALFYIRREREERAAGRSEGAALAAAAATSGRAVLVSGMTVLIAMAGMFLSGDKTFMSFSVGTMIVVAVAMVGSLTVLPAILSGWATGSRGRIPFLHRLAAPTRRRHLERPDPSSGGRLDDRRGAVLLALAVPALACTRADRHGRHQHAGRRALRRVMDAFPGTPEPATVAIKADDVTRAPVARGRRARAQGARDPAR